MRTPIFLRIDALAPNLCAPISREATADPRGASEAQGTPHELTRPPRAWREPGAPGVRLGPALCSKGRDSPRTEGGPRIFSARGFGRTRSPSYVRTSRPTERGDLGVRAEPTLGSEAKLTPDRGRPPNVIRQGHSHDKGPLMREVRRAYGQSANKHPRTENL